MSHLSVAAPGRGLKHLAGQAFRRSAQALRVWHQFRRITVSTRGRLHLVMRWAEP